jgi:hypothetical protein
MNTNECASQNKRVLVFPASRYFRGAFGNETTFTKLVVGDKAHVLKGNLQVTASEVLEDWLSDRNSTEQWDLIALIGSTSEPERLKAIGTLAGWVALKAVKLGAKFGMLMVTGDQLHSLQRELINLARNADASVVTMEQVEGNPDLVPSLLHAWATQLDWIQETRNASPEELTVERKPTVRINLPPRPSALQITIPPLSNAVSDAGKRTEPPTVRINLPPRPSAVLQA